VHGFVRRAAEQELPDGTLSVRYRFVHVLYQNTLYGSLTPSRRASWSGLVAQGLLDHYGDRAREIAADLALLLEAARDFERAAEHFLVAAQQAARVFANQESATLARRGLALLSRLPDTPTRARWELLLQITLGAALSATKGIGSADTGRTFERAAALREQLGDIPELSAVSGGLWAFYIVGARMQRARAEAEDIFRIAQQKGDRASMSAAHNALGTTLIHLGEWKEALDHLIQGSQADPESAPTLSGFPIIPAIQCQSEASRALWVLGRPDQGLRLIERALAQARAVGHPESLGFALLFAAWVRQLRREAPETLANAEQVLALSREREIATTLAWGTPLYGWALAALGRTDEGLEQIRGSLAAQRAAGAEIARPQFLSMLVEAARFGGRQDEALAAVQEALAVSERTGNSYWDADLYRLKADLLLEAALTVYRLKADLLLEAALTEPSTFVDVEACCHRALEIARRQHAKSLELRAATTFARLRQRQGRIDEARIFLSEIYGWFTEGLDTADLRDARDILASFG
jgi:predicted ATPase